MIWDTYTCITGPGPGRPPNALGLALRSVGHGRKVVIVQFMKWWKDTGEYQNNGAAQALLRDPPVREAGLDMPGCIEE